MADLLPRYPEHWILGIESQPEFHYWGRRIPQQTQAWLWYNMEPKHGIETLANTFREKHGVIDNDEAMNYLAMWNKTVKEGAPEVEFEAVFGVGYGKMGVLTDPKDANVCLLFGLYDVSIPYHTKTGAGSGGYAWQCLVKRPLRDDQETHQMLAERFALWNKQGRINLIRMWNRLLEGK